MAVGVSEQEPAAHELRLQRGEYQVRMDIVLLIAFLQRQYATSYQMGRWLPIFRLG